MGLPLGNAVLSGRSAISDAPHPPKSPRPRAVPVTRVDASFLLTARTPPGRQNPLQTPRRRKAAKDRLGGRMKKYTHRQLPAHSPRQPTPRTLAESIRILAQRSGAGRPHCRPQSKLQRPRRSAEVCANSCHFDVPRSNQNAARTTSRSAKNQQLTYKTRHNER